MSRPRLLVFGNVDELPGDVDSLLARLGETAETNRPGDMQAAVQAIRTGDFCGLLILGQPDAAAGLLLESEGILEHVPDGLVLVDADLKIVWSNAQLAEFAGAESVVGEAFYELFAELEILGPDFDPFNSALGSGESARSLLRVGEKRYFEVHVQPVEGMETEFSLPEFLVGIVRDVTAEVLQKQKLKAVYQAGQELYDLTPQELMELSVDDRVQLLRERILMFTQELLEFDTVEIRLLDKHTNRLEPLLSVGMDAEAATRVLFAKNEANGVTGYVAATGNSYLCKDIAKDSLYLPGAPGACSSLTVPLTLHEEVLGTFNVESPQPGAFDDDDLQFLELFAREVAAALNTMELLAAQRASVATEHAVRLLSEVAGPADAILNDAAWILERYIGHEPELCERLQGILTNTRDIKQTIKGVGATAGGSSDLLGGPTRSEHPSLDGKRILVVDEDDSVRQAAHELLSRFGCDVETAHNGDEAFLMTRTFHYHAVLADIRLPDMNGYECFRRLREIHEHMPVILMTGFGYDPTHSIVKARQEGLKSVLYKPFRLDQLVGELEAAFETADAVPEAAAQT